MTRHRDVDDGLDETLMGDVQVTGSSVKEGLHGGSRRSDARGRAEFHESGASADFDLERAGRAGRHYFQRGPESPFPNGETQEATTERLGEGMRLRRTRRSSAAPQPTASSSATSSSSTEPVEETRGWRDRLTQRARGAIEGIRRFGGALRAASGRLPQKT